MKPNTSLSKGLALIFMASLLAVGCGKAPEHDNSIANARAVRDGGGATPTDSGKAPVDKDGKPGVNPFEYDESVVGEIFMISSSTEEAFTKTVKNFLGSFMDVEGLGEISGTAGNNETGIRFQGRFALPEKRADEIVEADADFSNLIMIFYDSLVGETVPNEDGEEEKIPPIVISFKQAESVKRRGDNFIVEFKDEYQTISFVGEISGGSAIGEVDFKNHKEYEAGVKLKSGTLGNFSIPIENFLIQIR